MIDEANGLEPITASDIEETPQKSAGRPARGRRSAARPLTDQPGLAGLNRGAAPLRRKTHVSTRRIGYADDADFTGSYLRLDRLTGYLDSYPSHQRFWSETTPVSPESLYAGYGPRDEEPRLRQSTDAAAGGAI
jgi:hypothetical protein